MKLISLKSPLSEIATCAFLISYRNERGEYKFNIRIKKTNGEVIENANRPILIEGVLKTNEKME